MRLGQRGDHRIHHLHRMLAAEPRIRLHRILRHFWIALQRLVRPGQPHRVHADRLDLLHDRLERRVVQPTGNELLLVKSVPVHRGQADRTSVRIHNPTSLCMQRRRRLLARAAAAIQTQSTHSTDLRTCAFNEDAFSSGKDTPWRCKRGKDEAQRDATIVGGLPLDVGSESSKRRQYFLNSATGGDSSPWDPTQARTPSVESQSLNSTTAKQRRRRHSPRQRQDTPFHPRRLPSGRRESVARH